MNDRDIEELQRIWDLKEKGAISEVEYRQLKSRILSAEQKSPPEAVASVPQVEREHRLDPLTRPNSDRPKTLTQGAKKMGLGKIAGLGCLGFLGLVFLIGLLASPATQNSSTAVPNASGNTAADTVNLANATSDAPKTESGSIITSPWSYSQDEDKVRGGTTYYASTTSTNSISQEAPYDSDTTMTLAVRKSQAYGTDVILTISSGQMMCPSYEGCGGVPRQHLWPRFEVVI